MHGKRIGEEIIEYANYQIIACGLTEQINKLLCGGDVGNLNPKRDVPFQKGKKNLAFF
jgi:hypothetical protein